MRTPTLALTVLFACSGGADDEPTSDGGATDDGGGALDGGGAQDGGGTADGGGTDGGAGDGGAGDGGAGDGGAGDGGASGLDWVEVTPGDAPSTCKGTLLHASTTATSHSGVVLLDADLPAGRSFHVDVATADPSNSPLIYKLLAPSGRSVLWAESWWSSTELLTSAVWPNSEVANLNWPIRDEDPAYEPGEWTIQIGVVDSAGSWADGADVEVDLFVTQDPDATEGCVYVDVVTSDGIAADTGLMVQLETAVARFTEVYADYGLTVVPDWGEASLGDNLIKPSDGSAAYRSLTSASGAHSMVMVVGETIGSSDTILGQAGNVPGSLAPASRGVVAVSWLLHAGGDGRLSPTEATFMGETMAHEAGHYLGLFRPLEINSDNSVTWTDSLEDTVTCTSGTGDCSTLLGENLMFPWALCMAGYCEAQDDLTDDQASVLHRTGRAL